MVVAGFIRPDGGSVMVADREMVRVPPHKRNIGVMFQNYALFPHMSVAENIAYPLKLRGLDRATIGAKVAEVLDLVQLAGYGERRVEQLSGGQRQRVAFARAVVFGPRVLLMDEPLSALDKQLRERMQHELRRLHQRLETTTIAVSHDQREALTMSSRVAVLDKGRIRQVGTPAELYERPANRFVAEFIGESFFLPVAGDGAEATAGGSRVRLAHRPSQTGRNGCLLIRPEKLLIVTGDRDDLNVFDGVVTDIVFQGDSLMIDVRLADGSEIAARCANRYAGDIPKVGDAVRLGLHPEDSIVVYDDD
jgi:putative spermidine/putrescine transport system ATP-binding protein